WVALLQKLLQGLGGKFLVEIHLAGQNAVPTVLPHDRRELPLHFGQCAEGASFSQRADSRHGDAMRQTERTHSPFRLRSFAELQARRLSEDRQTGTLDTTLT